jgi:hypothetical protein
MANLAPGPCPRCDYPPDGLDKFRKPNGGVAWFCQGCTWVGDDQSFKEFNGPVLNPGLTKITERAIDQAVNSEGFASESQGITALPESKPPVEDIQAITAEPNKESKKSRGGISGKNQKGR